MPTEQPPAAPAPDLDALEGLDKARTQGEWRYPNGARSNTGYVVCQGDAATGYVHIGEVGDFADKELVPFNADRWRADGMFIAALANAAPWLIAQARRCAVLEEALGRIAAATDPYEPCGWAIETARAALTGAQPSRLAALEAENARLRDDLGRIAGWLEKPSGPYEAQVALALARAALSPAPAPASAGGSEEQQQQREQR